MIQELFRKVRRKAQAKAGSEFEAYWQNVVARLAAGEQLDPEAVVESATAIGRDAAAVEKDVALFLRRQQIAQELAALPGWQRESAKLQAQLDRLNAELAEAQTRLGSQIQAAYAAKQAIDIQITGTAQFERDLVQSCPNPELAQRETELQQQRRELLERRRALVDAAADGGPGTLGSALDHARRQLEQYQERSDSDSRQHAEKLKGYIAGCKLRIRQAESQRADIDEQLAQLDRELVEVRNAKLIP